jgi:hypothetical protein
MEQHEIAKNLLMNRTCKTCNKRPGAVFSVICYLSWVDPKYKEGMCEHWSEDK